MRADRHTRTVAWLKVALPLAALGLLSTMFLLSRAIDPDAAIPFADKEIQDRLRDQQVTGPIFSGTTADGDELSFQATKLITPKGEVGISRADDVRAEIRTADGAEIQMHAQMASFDVAADAAELQGGVEIVTSTGYKINTDVLISEMSSLRILAPGMITANGPPGDFTAGSMELTSPRGSATSQLLFTGGVKLVYIPKQELK